MKSVQVCTDPKHELLYHLLCDWRQTQSQKESIPPGYILPHKVIENIVLNPPKSIQELFQIKGFGLQKIKKYAVGVLSILSIETRQETVVSFINDAQKTKNKKKRKPSKQNTTIRSYFNVKGPLETEKERVITDTDISELSPSQKKIFEAYQNNSNLFITGPAGTGKSYLIKKIVQDATSRGKCVQCCALTGCAAILLDCNAKTIHSWSGVGILNKPDDEIIHSLLLKKYKHKSWKSTDILIIDEISMMNARLFSLLNNIGKLIRRNKKPFGGVQIILSGDFYQLPPITGKFCFESPDWAECIQQSILLKTIYRQNDPVFTKILNQIRKGRISKRTYNILNECVEKDKTDLNGISPTVILPRKYQTELINNSHLEKLDTPSVLFEAKVNHAGCRNVNHVFIEYEIKHMFQTNVFDKYVTVKVGAQVMCISNLDMENEICNGSIGKIIEISPNEVLVQFKKCTQWIKPHVWASESIEGLSISQLPIILAWSCTIHKIQGATLELVDIDVGSGIFECGQTYVALSRVRNLKGLYMRSFDPLKITVNKKVHKYYTNLESESVLI